MNLGPKFSNAGQGDGTSAAALVAVLISDLLAAGDALDTRIEQALARIGAFAGADRAYVIRIRDGGTFDNTHEWVAEGVASGKAELQGVPVARMNPEIRAARRPLYIPSVPDLPEDAPHRAHLMAQGIQSLLIAPMIDGERRIGLVGFDAVKGRRAFSRAEVELLAAFTGLLTSVILRAEAESRAAKVRRDLAAAETRLRTTLSTVPDAVLDLDAGGRIVLAHSRLPEILAAPAADLTGQTLDDAAAPDLAAACRRCLDRLLHGGVAAGSREAETLALPTPDGDRRWVEVTAVAHDHAIDDAPLGWVIVLRDVSEEHRQASRREMLDEVARRTHNLVVVTDADRRITWVNEAFERRTGWTLAEIHGINPGDLLQCEATDKAEVARIAADLAAGLPVKSELLNRARDGGLYWVELDIQPLRAPDGTLRGFHSIQTDISERKAAAAALAQAAQAAAEGHARLVAAVDALPDAFAYFDAEDRLVLCNDRYRRVTRVPGHDDILGLTFDTIIRGVAQTRLADGSIDDAEAWVAARLASHRAPGAPFPLRLSDGRWVKVLEKCTPDGGRVTMLIDITAERTATQQLEDTFDAAKAGTWRWTLDAEDGLLLDDRIARILGYGSAADLGEMSVARWQSLMHPEDRGPIGADWNRLRSDRDSVSDHVYRVRHRDGHYIWVLSRGRRQGHQPPGAPASRIGVIIDITERKQLEAALEAERDYLETLMETSMSAITALDEEGNIVYANREAELLFGLSSEDIESRTFDAPEWQATDLDGNPLPVRDMPFERVRRTGKAVRDVRHALNWPDGRRQILSINAAPVDRPDSEVRVVCAIRDVTAETADEAALRDAVLRAREATEAKSRFLASMSHEIRTPLNGVLGMAELLDLALTDPAHKEMAGVIRESGALLLTVLNDILDMSKIEAGKLTLEIAPFRPDGLCAAVEALHSVTAQRKGIDLAVWAGDGLDLPRLGDVHRIQQILHNLVGNAVKFTEAGEVSVTLTARPGGPLAIRVADTGPGMTAAQVERVFDEFEQADATIARRHGGSGLGLAIVNRLVRQMGGDISIDSAPGRGTEFRVTLPLPEAEADGPAARADAPPGSPAEDGLAGLRALVADDNATNRMILSAMLDRLGIAARMVGDGQEAVEAWEPGEFDLVLLDITMPRMGGIEALGLIHASAARAGTPPVPAVAITANAMAHQIEAYIDAGFDAHVPKPLSLVTLRSTLSRVRAKTA
ncbi:MAG: PAS domain S-box protein [Rhodobacteraceae bacterium]|nr:PAS domain S-box protein [Paracoccaceae bacterium]